MPAATTAWPIAAAFFPPAIAPTPFAARPIPFIANTLSANEFIAPIVSCAPSMPSYMPRFSKRSGVRASVISLNESCQSPRKPLTALPSAPTSDSTPRATPRARPNPTSAAPLTIPPNTLPNAVPMPLATLRPMYASAPCSPVGSSQIPRTPAFALSHVQ